jgi:hypothetical protein
VAAALDDLKDKVRPMRLDIIEHCYGDVEVICAE